MERKKKLNIALFCNFKSSHIDNWIEALSNKGLNVRAFYSHREILKNLKNFEVIHYHGLGSLSLLDVIIIKVYRKKCVLSIWGSDIVKSFKDYAFFRKILYRFLVLLTNDVTAPSKFLAKTTIENIGCRFLRKLHIVPFGINERYFNQRVTSNIRKELGNPKYIIGSIKFFRPYYGLHYLLKAAPIILKNFPDTIFLLVGYMKQDKKWYNKLKELSKTLEIQEKVHFVNFVPHEEIARYLTAMDVFVMPSLREGFGVSAIEAMSVGIPVVASNVGGIPDIIKHKKNGLLVSPQNEFQIARAVVEIIKNPKTRETLIKNGVEFAQNLTLEKVADKMISVYKKF